MSRLNTKADVETATRLQTKATEYSVTIHLALQAALAAENLDEGSYKNAIDAAAEMDSIIGALAHRLQDAALRAGEEATRAESFYDVITLLKGDD